MELGIDTNRDFPYGRYDTKCLKTSTGKIINSIMKNNLIQLVITFHGGMAAIGYEWGSLNHPKPQDDCPDSIIHQRIAKYMSNIAGSWISSNRDSQKYPYGKMNTVIYPVDGGLEDWVYASGWDLSTNQIKLCDGYTYYKPYINIKNELEQINNNNNHNEEEEYILTDFSNPYIQANHNRAIVFLIETSDLKKPLPNTWGKQSDVIFNI